MVHTIVRELAHLLTDFPGAVGLAVVQIPRELAVRREAGHRSSAAGNRYGAHRHKHPRADNVSSRNRVTQGDVAKRAVNANIADRCKSGFEGDARVGNGFKGNLRSGFLELRNGVSISGAVRQMCVAVNQARQHGHLRKIDYGGLRRNGKILAGSFDLSSTHENYLVRQKASRFDIHEFPSTNRRNRRSSSGLRLLRDTRNGSAKQEEKRPNRYSWHRFPLRRVFGDAHSIWRQTD